MLDMESLLYWLVNVNDQYVSVSNSVISAVFFVTKQQHVGRSLSRGHMTLSSWKKKINRRARHEAPNLGIALWDLNSFLSKIQQFCFPSTSGNRTEMKVNKLNSAMEEYHMCSHQASPRTHHHMPLPTVDLVLPWNKHYLIRKKNEENW